MGTKYEPSRDGDRHRQSFMVRLPEIFRTKLRLLRERTGQPMTALIRTAIKRFLQANRVWTKKDEEELKRQEQPQPE